MTKEEFFGKFKSLFLWGNLAAMVVTVLLFFFGLKWFLSCYTHHGENIEVPDLYAKDLKTAEMMLEDRGLQLKQVATTYDRNLPGGTIVTQSPKAGSSVKEGRQVYVTVNSLTAPKVKIPNVIGNKSYRSTQAELQNLEFEVNPTPIYVDGPRDLVMGIDCNGRAVANGEEVAKYSRLTLRIGNGAGDNEGYETEELEELPEDVIINEIIEEEIIDEDYGDPYEVFE